MVVRWLHSIGDALQRVPRAVCWTLVVAWFALISSLSSIPGSQVPSSRLWAVITNLAHAPLFGVLALWIALLVPRKGGWPDLIPAHTARVLAAIAAFGLADELHQNFFTPGRDMSVFDLCTDLAGASTVLAVARHVGRQFGRDGSGALGLAWRCAVGLAACIACACAATFIPRMFPSLVWL